jgi:hypothetical protein
MQHTFIFLGRAGDEQSQAVQSVRVGAPRPRPPASQAGRSQGWNHCCGSGSAWIRIHLAFLDPDPGAWKLTKI